MATGAEHPHRRSERLQFVRNAVSAYGLRAVMAISVLVLTPYMYRKLGAGGFGTFSVVYTIGGIYVLIETGFSRGMSKVIAEQLADGDRDRVSYTIGTGFTLMAGVGVIVAATSIAIGLLFPGLGTDSSTHAFEIAMVAMGIERLVFFPLAAYGAALVGYQRYDYYYLCGVLNTVAFTIGTFVAIQAGGDVLAVLLVFSASHFLMGLAGIFFMRRTDRSISLRPRLGDKGTRRGLTSFSSFVLLAESMTFIGQRMDTLVIAAIRGPAAAGPYAAVLKLQTGLQSLTLPVIYQLMPMASDLWARRRVEEIQRRLALATRIVLQITLPVALALALFASDTIDLWLGEGAPEVADTILVIMMLVQIAALTAAPAEQVLVGIGRVRAVGLLTLVEGTSNLALSIVLVYLYGAIGAAIGTLATTALITPLKIPIACRALRTSSWSFVRSSVGIATLSSVPAIVAMGIVGVVMPEGAARLIVGGLAAVIPSAVVGVWQIGPGRVASALRSFGAAGGSEPLAAAGSTEP